MSAYRCEIDLSPGTRTRPAARDEGTTVWVSAGARSIHRTIAFALWAGSGLVCYPSAWIQSPDPFIRLRPPATAPGSPCPHVDARRDGSASDPQQVRHGGFRPGGERPRRSTG